MKIARQLYSGDVVVLQPVDAGHGCFYTAVCPDSSDQDARTHVLALEALSVQSAAQYPAAQFEVVCKGDYWGFKSHWANGKLLQARRKAPCMVFFNTLFGVYEQWQMESVQLSEGTEPGSRARGEEYAFRLTNRQLPSMQLLVRAYTIFDEPLQPQDLPQPPSSTSLSFQPPDLMQDHSMSDAMWPQAAAPQPAPSVGAGPITAARSTATPRQAVSSGVGGLPRPAIWQGSGLSTPAPSILHFTQLHGSTGTVPLAIPGSRAIHSQAGSLAGSRAGSPLVWRGRTSESGGPAGSVMGGTPGAGGSTAGSLQDDLLELSQRMVMRFVARATRARLYVAFKLWAGRARRAVRMERMVVVRAHEQRRRRAWHALCQYVHHRHHKRRISREATTFRQQKDRQAAASVLAAWAHMTAHSRMLQQLMVLQTRVLRSHMLRAVMQAWMDAADASQISGVRAAAHAARMLAARCLRAWQVTAAGASARAAAADRIYLVREAQTSAATFHAWRYWASRQTQLRVVFAQVSVLHLQWGLQAVLRAWHRSAARKAELRAVHEYMHTQHQQRRLQAAFLAWSSRATGRRHANAAVEAYRAGRVRGVCSEVLWAWVGWARGEARARALVSRLVAKRTRHTLHTVLLAWHCEARACAGAWDSSGEAGAGSVQARKAWQQPPVARLFSAWRHRSAQTRRLRWAAGVATRALQRSRTRHALRVWRLQVDETAGKLQGAAAARAQVVGRRVVRTWHELAAHKSVQRAKAEEMRSVFVVRMLAQGFYAWRGLLAGSMARQSQEVGAAALQQARGARLAQAVLHAWRQVVVDQRQVEKLVCAARLASTQRVMQHILGVWAQWAASARAAVRMAASRQLAQLRAALHAWRCMARAGQQLHRSVCVYQRLRASRLRRVVLGAWWQLACGAGAGLASGSRWASAFATPAASLPGTPTRSNYQHQQFNTLSPAQWADASYGPNAARASGLLLPLAAAGIMQGRKLQAVLHAWQGWAARRIGGRVAVAHARARARRRVLVGCLQALRGEVLAADAAMALAIRHARIVERAVAARALTTWRRALARGKRVAARVDARVAAKRRSLLSVSMRAWAHVALGLAEARRRAEVRGLRARQAVQQDVLQRWRQLAVELQHARSDAEALGTAKCQALAWSALAAWRHTAAASARHGGAVVRHMAGRQAVRVSRDVLRAWHAAAGECAGQRELYPLLCRVFFSWLTLAQNAATARVPGGRRSLSGTPRTARAGTFLLPAPAPAAAKGSALSSYTSALGPVSLDRARQQGLYSDDGTVAGLVAARAKALLARGSDGATGFNSALPAPSHLPPRARSLTGGREGRDRQSHAHIMGVTPAAAAAAAAIASRPLVQAPVPALPPTAVPALRAQPGESSPVQQPRPLASGWGAEGVGSSYRASPATAAAGAAQSPPTPTSSRYHPGELGVHGAVTGAAAVGAGAAQVCGSRGVEVSAPLGMPQASTSWAAAAAVGGGGNQDAQLPYAADDLLYMQLAANAAPKHGPLPGLTQGSTVAAAAPSRASTVAMQPHLPPQQPLLRASSQSRVSVQPADATQLAHTSGHESSHVTAHSYADAPAVFSLQQPASSDRIMADYLEAEAAQQLRHYNPAAAFPSSLYTEALASMPQPTASSQHPQQHPHLQPRDASVAGGSTTAVTANTVPVDGLWHKSSQAQRPPPQQQAVPPAAGVMGYSYEDDGRGSLHMKQGRPDSAGGSPQHRHSHSNQQHAQLGVQDQTLHQPGIGGVHKQQQQQRPHLAALKAALHGNHRGAGNLGVLGAWEARAGGAGVAQPGAAVPQHRAAAAVVAADSGGWAQAAPEIDAASLHGVHAGSASDGSGGGAMADAGGGAAGVVPETGASNRALDELLAELEGRSLRSIMPTPAPGPIHPPAAQHVAAAQAARTLSSASPYIRRQQPPIPSAPQPFLSTSQAYSLPLSDLYQPAAQQVGVEGTAVAHVGGSSSGWWPSHGGDGEVAVHFSGNFTLSPTKSFESHYHPADGQLQQQQKRHRGMPSMHAASNVAGGQQLSDSWQVAPPPAAAAAAAGMAHNAGPGTMDMGGGHGTAGVTPAAAARDPLLYGYTSLLHSCVGLEEAVATLTQATRSTGVPEWQRDLVMAQDPGARVVGDVEADLLAHEAARLRGELAVRALATQHTREARGLSNM